MSTASSTRWSRSSKPLPDSPSRLPAAGLAVFLKGLQEQEIPADPLRQRSFTGDAVRLLTAHRSKGLEWEFVVVAGVQEGVWPDLRLPQHAAGSRRSRLGRR